MELVTLDFETFYSATHSLSAMSPIAYVNHPDTEIISLSAKFGKRETQCVFGEAEIKKAVSCIDWSDKLVVAHNNEGFDSMLLAWRLGVRPAMWGCTLAMARPIHAKTTGLSLGALAEYYGVGVKDGTALTNTKGKHLVDFTPEELAAMKAYNIADVDLCYGVFKHLFKVTPKRELMLIDQTIRMLVEPQFEVDRAGLSTALAEVRRQQLKALVSLGDMLGTDDPEEVRSTLASAVKFSKVLADRGVPVPMKISKKTGKPAPALAKTDEDFLALQEHDDEVVAAAAQARLGVKSTILETRIQAFIDASDAVKGKLPVPLKYYGADTTGRWCLAEGTMVLVRDPNGVVFDLPIQDVTTYYEVWDGIEWVRHMGAEFSGDKDVVTWDGVTATREHIVWVDAETKVHLGYAYDNGIKLWGGNRVPDI